MSAMLTLEEAQERLLALAPAMPQADLSLSNAPLGRFLAADHRAKRTQPPADLSAMDGYAICGGGPWKRMGESRAGAPFAGSLKSGQCVRISTGAYMPQGSDRVLIQENAIIDGDWVDAESQDIPPSGHHVRKAGFDFREGDTVLQKSQRLTPASLALAIAAGLDRLSLFEPPRIAVLDSGDELAQPGRLVHRNQIPASNGPMLAAMFSPLVGEVKRLGPVPDDMESLLRALDRTADCHILVTSGGASVGDHDHMQGALRAWGAEIEFWKVAIKPGKPLLVASRKAGTMRQVILGLPGNPVSSFVTAFLFAMPLIRAAMGDPQPLPRTVEAIAEVDFPSGGPRHEFIRGLSEGLIVRPVASQDSSALRSLASANCLIDRPLRCPPVKAGDRISVYNLHIG